ncbi:MAG: nodulation protein NfeD, partial [Fidelibacterota bacterium]
RGSELIIIELDTPGGLMESMRKIVKEILSADIPVVVYVSPRGSRAASAGVFITLSAHIAVMNHSTNIGAAHPVSFGMKDTANVMAEKITNDAVAQIKAIAEKRGRNVEWAEDAVRKSVSITENEALGKNVIDFISPDLDSLLKLIDGMEVEILSGKKVLSTSDIIVRRISMNWRYRFLYKIADPNIAYILMILGFYGLFFELSNPGSILPGVVGGIFIILAFFALQMFPINFAGLLLILFALILFILEIKVTSFGVLTLGGIVSLILGSLMLIDTPVPAMRISLSVIIPVAITTAAFFVFAMYKYFIVHRTRPKTGKEGLIGEIGIARTKIDPQGEVNIHGEIWKAYSSEPINAGDEVEVVKVEKLTIFVKKIGN